MRLIENLHTHTFRCGHASGEDRAYVEAAIRAGVRVLGFSDHAPMLFPKESGYYSGFRMPIAAYEGYVTSVCELREAYRSDIEIRLGAELEYYPALFRDTLAFLCDYPIDYLIMGQHFIGNEYDVSGRYSGSATEDPSHLVRYVDQVLEGLSTGAFTYLAHPDLLHFTGEVDTYRREARRLLEGVKALGLPVEFNFLGFREGRHYPRREMWELVREVGNDVVLGLDAHDPETYGLEEPFERMRAYLDDRGITPLTHIPLRDPHQVKLS